MGEQRTAADPVDAATRAGITGQPGVAGFTKMGLAGFPAAPAAKKRPIHRLVPSDVAASYSA